MLADARAWHRSDSLDTPPPHVQLDRTTTSIQLPLTRPHHNLISNAPLMHPPHHTDPEKGQYMRCTKNDRDALAVLMESNLELSTLEARLQTLPERDKVKKLEEDLRATQDNSVRARVSEREQRTDVMRLRQEVAKLRARERDNRHSLSTATDPERRKDIRHDLATTQRKLEDFEDRLMRAERTAQTFDAPVEEDSHMADRVALTEALQALARAENAIEADMSAANARIASARSRVNPGVLDLYDQGQAEHGVGAAWLKGRTCQGCFMELDPATMKDIRHTPADQLQQCPECNVILLVHSQD